jgi:uncharacterized membrane protein
MFAVLFFAQFSALPAMRLRVDGVLRREQALLVLANAAFIMVACHALFWPVRLWILTAATGVLALGHLALAWTIPRAATGESTARVLFSGLALTFATLVIPIRLEGHWVPIALAVEAGVLVWSGFRLRSGYLRGAGYALFWAAVVALLATPTGSPVFVFNETFGAAVVIAVAAAISAWRAHRSRDQLSKIEHAVVTCLAVGANVLMVAALTREVGLYFDVTPGRGAAASEGLLARSLAVSLLWTLYATVLVLTGTRLRTAALRWQGLALLGVTTLKVFFADLGYLSGLYRVSSSIALGVVLIALSFLYQRKLAARHSARADDR